MAKEPRRPVIGIDVTSAVTQGGGIGRYTRELVRALLANDDGNQYRLFSAKFPSRLPVTDPLPTAANATLHEAPVSDRWLYRIWFRLQMPLFVQLFTGPLDLFHSPDFVLPPVRGKIPTVLTVHDLSFLHFPGTFTPALVRYLKEAVPRSVNKASSVVADSAATRRDLIHAWDVGSDKIEVLYSGVNRQFQPQPESGEQERLRKKYDIGMMPYLLAVGTLQPRKNYEMLIAAFAPLAAESELNLVIAGGKGWLTERIHREVASRGLNDRVRLVGFVDDDDLPGLYRSAEIFLFPSLYEGFGLPVLEAMACGVPVISSSASSLPEVAGDAAIMVSPENRGLWTAAMRRLLADRDERDRLRHAGLLQAQKFSWSAAASELRGLYRKLLGENLGV